MLLDIWNIFEIVCITSVVIPISVFGIQTKENNSNNEPHCITIKTPLGNIMGKSIKSRNGNDIYAFLGIRYAEPPIGVNRFKDPVPVKPWKDKTIDATKEGWMCPQFPVFFNESFTNEDCLILNIYTKQYVPANTSVLVYIHGGGFIIGGSHSKLALGPEYFLDNDIILVTINYRLGPFGFLSTGNKDCPGNFGFKDQVIALKWIKQNIEYFGGNSNSVTIMGESAGSMSVSLHLVSSMSYGLFHAAIMMSGTVMCQYLSQSQSSTKKLAEMLECPTDNSNNLIQCLRDMPYEKITKVSNEMLLGNMFLPWMYEIDGNYSDEPFVTDNPTKLLSNGEFNKVPIIIGVTKDECAPLAAVLNENLKRNFDNVAPEYLLYGNNAENVSVITETLKNFYMKSNTKEGIEALFVDAIIDFGVHRFANLAKNYTDVYYYRLDFQGRFGLFNHAKGKVEGVYHADDLQYIFPNNKNPIFQPEDRENIMVERLTNWITAFAKTGNPNSLPNKWTEGCEWPVSNASQVFALYIDETCHIGEEPFLDRMKLWDDLFPIPT